MLKHHVEIIIPSMIWLNAAELASMLDRVVAVASVRRRLGGGAALQARRNLGAYAIAPILRLSMPASAAIRE